LAVEAGVIDSWAVGNGGHAVIYGKQNLEPVYVNRSETGLPIQVQEWLGVPTQSGEMRDRRKSDLTQLNDEKHYTFNKIAEVIEAGDLLLEGDSREF
jgi:hypothetical protein